MIPGDRIPTILIVCTGNQCRSPMASAMLTALLAARGASVRVESAGFVGHGEACPGEVQEVMADLGYDLSGHRSRLVNETMARESDLIIGIARQHVIDASLLGPGAWRRAFTLQELVRLGEAAGPIQTGQSLERWISGIGTARTRQGILNLPLSEDVPDPIGKPVRAYVACRDRLLGLITQLTDLVHPV